MRLKVAGRLGDAGGSLDGEMLVNHGWHGSSRIEIGRRILKACHGGWRARLEQKRTRVTKREIRRKESESLATDETLIEHGSYFWLRQGD
jgi:hypothetical protein